MMIRKTTGQRPLSAGRVVAFGVGFMLAAACGDDSGDDGASSATTTATTSGDTDETMMSPDPSTSSGMVDGTASTGPGPIATEGTGDSTTGTPDDGVITFDEVQPIFADRCSPCHTGGGFGGHNIGVGDLDTAYADSQLDATHPDCGGMSKGECTLVRIQSGEMPMGFGCSGDPKVDADDPLCLTADEQNLIQAWLDDGELPSP